MNWYDKKSRIHGRGLPRFASLNMMSGEGEGGEGGGGEGGAATFTEEQLQAKIDEAIGGLKNKNKELLGTVSQAKDQLKAWEGLDPANVKNMLERLEKDEELKLMAEGKHDEAFQKRLEKITASHTSEVEGVTSERDTYKTELEKAQNQIRDLVIDQQVLSSFMSEKGLESAAPDVVLRAKATFKIEDGTPIARNDKNEIIRGKDGAITIQEWIQSLKDTAPHLFPGSSGAGASGGQGGGGSDIDSRMAAAAASGDMVEYKRLRKEKNSAA